MADFIHLRTHTALDIARGALQIKNLASLCARHGMPAIGITDRGTMFSALEASVTLAGAGIQPIMGCLLPVRHEVGDIGMVSPVTLLARNEEGYGNLLKLVSAAHLTPRPHDTPPSVALDSLLSRHDGLVLLTGGGRGLLAETLDRAGDTAARGLAGQLADAYGDRLYVELERHGRPDEIRSEPWLVDYAFDAGLPLVATNDVLFEQASQATAQEVLACIGEHTTISRDHTQAGPEHRFKSGDEMRALFADLPEACDNTVLIARRCAVMSRKRAPILPHAPQAEEVRTPDGLAPDGAAAEAGHGNDSEALALARVAREGLDRRLEKGCAAGYVIADYRQRLDYELGIINKMGFPGYFLIVADFIQWSKNHGISVGPGRGSGAGSLVAWALTITDLDPLRFGLLFERFLNPERVSMPDFDIDFCQERRGEVIRYVQEFYGQDRVAQIITFGKLQARAAVRSTGRVLEAPNGLVDRICKLIPNDPGVPITVRMAIDSDERLQEFERDPVAGPVLKRAIEIEGLYQNASTHAAGVVIGDRPLDELVPLYKDPDGDMPVTQFNMKWVEQAGLVKFDFLGLQTLTVLERCRGYIRESGGPDIDPQALPLDDDDTYRLLASGHTHGVFQLESAGMRSVLRQLGPTCIEDVVAIVALYRPGPMDNIPDFINGKRTGRYTYIDSEVHHVVAETPLAAVLDETYGIMVYQEQVMQAAQILAGYTLGGADLLRRAMGKKIKEEMDQQRVMFVDGCARNGISGEMASKVFDNIAKFAGYGFNKSHAAAYAVIAYQTAWMKAHYPAAFIAANMSLNIANTAKLAGFRGEAVRLGVPLLPPDINTSRGDFTVETVPVESGGRRGAQAIRYGMGALKNVSPGHIEAVSVERARGGTYRSFADFCARVPDKTINKTSIRRLAACGAFEGLHDVPGRAALYEGVDIAVKAVEEAGARRKKGMDDLFAAAGVAADPVISLPGVEWDERTRLAREFEAAGLYLTGHPLDPFQSILNARPGLVTAAMLADNPPEGRGEVAGVMTRKKEKISKTTGKKFAFVEMGDATGTFEVIFGAAMLERNRADLEAGHPLLVTVKIEQRGDGEMPALVAREAVPVEDALIRSPAPGAENQGSEAPALVPEQAPKRRRTPGSGFSAYTMTS